MDYWGKYTQRRLPFSKSLWMPNPFSWGTLGPHPPCPIFSRDSAAAVAWGFVFKHNYYGDTVLPDAGGQKDLRSPDLVGAALKVAAVPLSPGPTWPGAFHPPPPAPRCFHKHCPARGSWAGAVGPPFLPVSAQYPAVTSYS